MGYQAPKPPDSEPVVGERVPLGDFVPDPKMHLYVSLAKSALRGIAGLALIFGHVVTAGVLLIAAEILGVVEEIV